MSKPLNNVKYIIHGSDVFGGWSMQVTCKHYSNKNRKSLSKCQRKYGYRWVADNGEVIHHAEVESFERLESLK